MRDAFLKNTQNRVLFNTIVLLLLQWFFIGYWILKTGLNFHSGPFFFDPGQLIQTPVPPAFPLPVVKKIPESVLFSKHLQSESVPRLLQLLFFLQNEKFSAVCPLSV